MHATVSGRLFYHVWHRPLGLIRSHLACGPWYFARARRSERAMIGMASQLSPPPFSPAPPHWPRISFMTGVHHWHQTVFCARSLEYACQLRPTFEILDDGSLDDRLADQLQSLFPGSMILRAADAAQRVEASLPSTRYPNLHRARLRHVMMRKLVDLRVGRSGWHLYLDSDMLFFARPDLLLRWLDAPSTDVFMDDTPPPRVRVKDGSLGYVDSVSAIEAKTKLVVLPFVNAGLVGLDDSRVDWDRLEHACGAFAIYGPQMLEQTLTALHLAMRPAQRLPRTEYRCHFFPGNPPDAALMHYVYRAKAFYLAAEWRRWVRTVAPMADPHQGAGRPPAGHARLS